LYIGLMSGTSLDGVDGVVAGFAGDVPQVLAHASAPFDPALRAELMALNTAGDNEIHRGALAANGVARAYAGVVADLLGQSRIASSRITAIGAHGQTVRHQPLQFDGVGYTTQLLNASLLAELSGIDVVADLRSRDLAAGGQGAPLAPAFHQAVFGRSGEPLAVLNLGGISNLSVLPGAGGQESGVVGFDCGPGNALLDYWCQQHRGQPYDADGAWAASGKVLPDLLKAFLAEPYLGKAPPKSTGRDLFNPAWLTAHLAQRPGMAPVDVQATLAQLTAQACVDDAAQHAPHARRLVVCGGGALNGDLLRRLQAGLADLKVESSDAHGLPPQQVEAAAFAWLAWRTMSRLPGSLASVTGARGDRVLGAIYPA
jgi:anhydro-N-acetylmuramic acid kinase